MQMESKPEQTLDAPKKVVILGGGFAGLNAAKSLCSGLAGKLKDRKKVEILLINKNNYHLFTPLLYQASTGLVDLAAIAQPIRPQGIKKGFGFLEAEVMTINVQAQTVYLTDRYVTYDYLVIALGAVKDDTKVEGAAQYAIPLKTLDDGKRIHNRIVESFEKAAALGGGPEKDEYLSFVVMGGATGVELAGSMVDYIKDVAKNYPKIDVKRDCKVYVVEAGEKLFPGGDASLSDIVKRSLERRGVKIFLKTKVEKIDRSKISLSSGDVIRSWNVFDNTGIKPNTVLKTIPEDIVKKENGKIIVDEYLRIPEFRNVFAIGDNSDVVIGRHSDGKPKSAPATAESATEEGKYVGKLIARELNASLLQDSRNLRGQVHPFRYKEKGTMISIGLHTGVAKFPRHTFIGFSGWLIWRVVHLYLLATARAKLSVSLDWLFDLFGGRNTSQLP